jgi:hypothetical protein
MDLGNRCISTMNAIDRDDIRWFKKTFHRQISTETPDTQFSLDLLVAIAAQETGNIWAPLHDQVSVEKLLELCVGDVLDSDNGRKAFPPTKADLLAVQRGDEMFAIARDALVQMAVYVPGYASSAKKPNKFCHGFGIFQYDLQFFKVDPEYFLERRWRRFGASLAKCLEELGAAARRIGLANRLALTDLERVHVAIAYNSGSFKPSKGLQQGYFDGKQFYGERVMDFLRLSRTVESPSADAAVPAPSDGAAALALPTPVATTGRTFEVTVETAPLRLRSEPRIDKAKPSANVIAHLPDGHCVRFISGKQSDGFLEVETSLNGAHLRGFAATRFLIEVDGDVEIPIVTPNSTSPSEGIVAVVAPRTPGSVTRRTAAANALSLNEPDQPGRTGSTSNELRNQLWAIIDYLAVERSTHARYRPRDGVTFCNIYAQDYCHLAGVYLPRVWWTPDAIEWLAQGETVAPRLGKTIDEQRANDIFRWLRAFGPRFGWRQTGTLTKLQTEVNLGAIGLIIARRKLEGRSGHVAMVVPETNTELARRDGQGDVVAALQSQAGSTNFRFGTSKANWWNDERFAESAFWLHA